MFRFLFLTIVLSVSDLVLSEEMAMTCKCDISMPFVEVSKNSRPAVVHIRCDQGVDKGRNQNGYNPFERFQEELFNRFFGYGEKPQGGDTPLPVNTGSGFIVSEDGYIVTNYHVVKNMSRIVVERYGENDTQFMAELVGCDPNTDVAILKIECKKLPLPYLEFADSDAIDVGQWTIAIGHPFRLRDSVTAGVISAVHRGDLQISKLEDFIQTDAPINPGNSGGPLLNLEGKVIGVNTAILSRTGGGSIGVGFAVPSNIVSMVYKQIKETGVVDRAFLGVQVQSLDDTLRAGFRIPKGTTGVVISSIVQGSAAEKYGLQVGDVILQCNGEAIKSANHLNNFLGSMNANVKCQFKISRNGNVQNINITLGSRINDVNKPGNVFEKVGIVVEEVMPENAHKYNLKVNEQGVVVTDVLSGSSAEKAGLVRGGLIMVVNGTRILSISDLEEALSKANPKEPIIMLFKVGRNASFKSLQPMKN